MCEDHDSPQLAGIPEPTRSEYIRLFDMVKNKRNWRFPISTYLELSEDDVPKMITAIKLITGSRDVHVTPSEDFPGTYSVTAEGHFNAAS